MSELASALQDPGLIGVLPPSGTPIGSEALQSLVLSAAQQTDPEASVLWLRADSELARQCSLVRIARSKELPEQYVRAIDHPLAGLLRYLSDHPRTIICVNAPRDVEVVQDLLLRLASYRVVIDCPDADFATQLGCRSQITFRPLDPDDGRNWLRSRLPPAASHKFDATSLPDDLLQCPTRIATIEMLLHSGVQPQVADDTADALPQLARLWWTAHENRPIGRLIALWTFVDREITHPSLLRGAARLMQLEADAAFDEAYGVLEQLQIASRHASDGRWTIDSAWHAALSSTIPDTLAVAAREAWLRTVPDWNLADSPPDEVALHVERLIERISHTPNTDGSIRESLIRSTISLSRAVGAWQHGVVRALQYVKAVTRKSGASSPAAAQAWRDVAQLQQFGQQLLAARKSARAAEEVLEQLATSEQHELVEIKLDIAELDLAEGRAERAFHRLDQVRRLLLDFVPDAAQSARAMFLRGACLLAGKQLERSEQLLQRSLEIRESMLPVDHEHLLATRSLLARNLFAQRRVQEAEQLLRGELQIRRDSPVVTPSELAVAANLLADLYFSTGRYLDAEPLLEEVLQVRQQTLNRNDRLVGEAAARLGGLKASRGDYSAADKLFRLSLRITEETFGEQHPRVADILNELAKMLFTQSRYDQSRRLLERALGIQQRAFRKGDYRIIESRNNLAAIYVARGHYEHAAQFYRESLESARRARGGDHPALATTLNNLGDVLRSLGRYPEAEELLVEALAMRERLHGPTHPVVAQSLSNLAYLRLLGGRDSEARVDVERALRIRRQTLGPLHPHTANSLTTLGRLAWRVRDNAAALTAFEESSEIHRRGFGDRTQQYGASLALLGRAELAAGRSAKAELHLLKARAILEDTVGVNHRLFADALLGLAELDEAEGRTTNAFPSLERALAIQKQTLGRDRFEVASTLLAVGKNLLRRGLASVACQRLAEAEKHLAALAEPPAWIVVELCIAAARAALDVGRHDEAEQQTRRGLAALPACDDSPARTELLTLRAATALAQERFAEAEQLLMPLIECEERKFGPDAVELIPLLDQMAATLTLQSRTTDAEAYVRRSLTLMERRHGRRHIAVAERLDQLATILLRSQRLEEARQLMAEVISIYDDQRQPDQTPLVASLKKQADLMHMLKRSNDAVQLETRAASLQNRTSHVLEDIL